ncbi:MAG: PspC domain-containing protein [Gordonia sp. (in: high G+C Gram-positive bacteria)]|uniref:PspC domain-containing protein n=1 Tax=Gordonia sp. (in: high G+C Gram-positive bacteria) TaxID=84139 RepID=UPI003C7526EA
MDTKTLLDLWNTRPVRPRSGKTLAGICTGIARRYRIDATLVKIAFLVAAFFGGAGVLLYVVGLIAFPADNETAPRPVRMRSRPARRGPHGVPWYAIVIGVIAVISISNMGSSAPFWSSGGLLGLVLMLLGWWLLYQRTPVAPAGTSADQLHPADGSAPLVPTASAMTNPLVESPLVANPIEGEAIPAPFETPVDVPAATGTDGVDAPPAWDPLGTARFAWDLPEPAAPPQPPAPKPPKSPLTPIFAGLAVIVAAGGTGGHLVGLEWFTVGRIAALALAVLGVGMLLDAVQRRQANTRATGLVWLAIIAGIIAVVATLSTTGRPTFVNDGIGERSYHPQGVEQLADTYELGIGNTVLDLRDVGPLDRDRTVTIKQGIGEVKVTLPDDVRVKTDCHTVVGDQTCPEGIVNPDAKTPTLTVKANLNMGSMEMKK